MAKSRSKKYQPKVKFEGTFEDMVKISTTGAGAKKWYSIQKKQPNQGQRIKVKYVNTPEVIDEYFFHSYEPQKRRRVGVIRIGGSPLTMITDEIYWQPV